LEYCILLSGLAGLGKLLMNFMSAHMNQCASRRMVKCSGGNNPFNLVAALLLTLILHWSKAKSIIDGLKFGALFGVLYASMIGFSFWSMTTMYSSIGVLLVDILLSTVVFAVMGFSDRAFLGKEK